MVILIVNWLLLQVNLYIQAVHNYLALNYDNSRINKMYRASIVVLKDVKLFLNFALMQVFTYVRCIYLVLHAQI